MINIRIYYESLEQANHYIKPIIAEACDGQHVNIVLVKRVGSAKDLPQGKVRAIHSLATPDILITGVVDDIETPLILIEFSEAVMTEDHELQRSYGPVAAYLANMFYLKVSGQKESSREHGGAEYNPYSTPRMFLNELDHQGFIIAEWRFVQDNPTILERSRDFPSCPPQIPILVQTIRHAISAYCGDQANWFDEALRNLQRETSYSEFMNRVNQSPGLSSLTTTWQEREERCSNKDRVRYFVEDNWIGAKINRFDHAMDPDRGILIFLSILFSNRTAVYGIYSIVRPRSGPELRGRIQDLSSLQRHVEAALIKDHGGIPSWLSNAIMNKVSEAGSVNSTIDFQGIWEANRSRIEDNKVAMTLAYFLDGMYLGYGGILLQWDKQALLGNASDSFIDSLRQHLGFSNDGSAASIEERANDVNEDEVTYLIAHRILFPNSFQIVSISYPGAQGGFAVLPEPEAGRAQRRRYIDLIALPPQDISSFDVLLNENKGMFSRAAITGDVRELNQYKTNHAYRGALTQSLVNAKVIDSNRELREILIGIGFGVRNGTRTTWDPSEVDFIFRVIHRSRWAIGIFSQSLRELIPTIEGNTDLPRCYKICPPD